MICLKLHQYVCMSWLYIGVRLFFTVLYVRSQSWR